MKKQFNVKLADGTNSVIGCNEEQLPEILKYHFSGEQLESAIVTEIPQVTNVDKKITYRTMEGFISEVEEDNILEVLNLDGKILRNYKGWDIRRTENALLATPPDVWKDRTPILLTTVDELVHLDLIINGVQS
jgi:hypothetical protein